MSSFWASLSASQPSQSQQQQQGADDLAQEQASAAAARAAAASQSLFSQSSLGSQLFGAAYDFQPAPSQQQSGAKQSGHAEHNEVCLTCGSTNFLTDDATGVTVCAQCHTQSQTLSQVEVVGEEDVEALAARTGKGRMVSRRIGGKRKIASVEEIDNSVKLPDAEECLGGFQYLLQRAAECAADLVGLEEGVGGNNCDDDGGDNDVDDTCDNGRQIFIDTVGNIWFGYLTSWSEGGRKYSKLHPEVRFSLRDAFLGQIRRDMIMRHLSARCCEEIRVEEERLERMNKTSGKGRGQKRRRGGQAPSTNTAKASQSGEGKQMFGSVAAMLNSLSNDNIDDKVAALRLTPSLSLIGSIIHLALAVLRSGVASHQIVGWAASGAFPYLTNAYRHLSADFKHTLKPVKGFFTQPLPPPGLLDYQADILSIVCGLKLGKLSKLPGGVDNITLLATRMVSDLGFDRKVLDYTLSLLGLRDLPPPDQEWAPRPLVKNIKRLSSPLHVLATIVVAVRMCKGWERQQYHINSESGIMKTDQSKKQKSNAFIPSSDVQLRQLSNCQLDNYLSFLESDVFDKNSRRSTLIRHFAASLQEMGKRHAKSLKTVDDSHTSSAAAVRRNTIVAGARVYGDHEHKTSAKIGDADGVYAIYKSCLTPRTRGDDQTETDLLDPLFALLIEYCAYKADAEPSDLYRLVAMLDKEIFEKASKRDEELRALMADDQCNTQPQAKTPKVVQHMEKSIQQNVKSNEAQQLNLFVCSNPASSTYHGLYQQHLPKPTKPKRKNRRCSIEGCEKEGIKRYAFMCTRHYKQSIGKESTYVNWNTLL